MDLISKNDVSVICYKARYWKGCHFITDLAVTRDGAKIILSSSDGLIQVLNDYDSNELAQIEGYIKGFHDLGINKIILDPNEDKIITGSCDGTIRIWDLENDTGLLFPDYYSGPITTVAISTNERKAVSATSSGVLIIWDLKKFKESKTQDVLSSIAFEIEEIRFKVISSLIIAPSGQIAFSYRKTIKIWNLENGIELKTLKGHTSDIISMIATPNGEKIISLDCNGSAKVWDIESGNELSTFECQMEDVDAVAIAPMGDKIIFASDNVIKIWDLENGKELMTLKVDKGYVQAVALSPDGLKAISGSSNGEINVWDLRKGNLLKTFIGHTYWIEALVISADGKLAISASHDRTLKVWSLFDFEEIAAFQGDSSYNSCAIAPDNVTIIAGDYSGRVHLLKLERR